MMDERHSSLLQLRRELAQITIDGLRTHMHQRIEAEDEIDRAIGNRRETVAFVAVIAHFRVGPKPSPARVHTLRVRIDEMQMAAMLFQVITPPSESRSD